MTQPQTQMRRSWLVQRLRKPAQRDSIFGKDNPFAFGGGLRNGGLSDDAMDLLRPIFSFDYMGAAEFEFGAVPKALRRIGENARNLVATSIDVRLADVAKHWRDKSEGEPVGSAPVYLLCAKADVAEVESRVRGWAGESFSELKEQTRLSSALRPVHDWDAETGGWLELDNGFMFFTDRDMWAATAAVFGVEVSA